MTLPGSGIIANARYNFLPRSTSKIFVSGDIAVYEIDQSKFS
jgi:hypothetical protein